MSNVSYNNHVSKVINQQGDSILLQPFTGHQAGMLIFADVKDISPVTELSRTEKTIELKKRKGTSWY